MDYKQEIKDVKQFFPKGGEKLKENHGLSNNEVRIAVARMIKKFRKQDNENR